jgi:hypothetical protein
MCKGSQVKPAWKAIEGLDLFLDRKALGVLKDDQLTSLEFSEITADDLTLLFESIHQAFQYK